jgi:hypothetical protein
MSTSVFAPAAKFRATFRATLGSSTGNIDYP